MKEEATEEVRFAIRTILKGELFVSRKMSVLALHKLLERSSEPGGNYVERLTDRELQVFQMIGAGKGTGDIAAELHVSPKTVETHREKIKCKLSLHSAAELKQFARKWAAENLSPTQSWTTSRARQAQPKK